MTAEEVTEKLVMESGRFDLVVDAVNSNFTDAGAYSLLNDAQRYLDEKYQIEKNQAWVYVKLEVGQYIVPLPNSKSIQGCWLSDGSNRVQLTRSTYADVFNTIASDPSTDLVNAQPSLWCPAPTQLAPEHSGEASSDFDTAGLFDYGRIIFGGDTSFGLAIGAPADKEYTLEILTDSYAGVIADPADVTWWTARYPDVLVLAGRLVIETRHRNMSGVEQWKTILDDRMRDIYHSTVYNRVGTIPAAQMKMNG